MNIRSLMVGRNNILQSTANLALGTWINETNFMATQPVAAFTNLISNCAAKFYRVAGYWRDMRLQQKV